MSCGTWKLLRFYIKLYFWPLSESQAKISLMLDPNIFCVLHYCWWLLERKMIIRNWSHPSHLPHFLQPWKQVWTCKLSPFWKKELLIFSGIMACVSKSVSKMTSMNLKCCSYVNASLISNVWSSSAKLRTYPNLQPKLNPTPLLKKFNYHYFLCQHHLPEHSPQLPRKKTNHL